MNSEKQNNKKTFLFSAMCSLVYFSSYITRINFAAAISEMILSLNVTKTLASIAITGSFITYGIGQVLSGILGDKIKPKTMIFLGLFITSICNIIVALLSSMHIMIVVWCINGFAQSMLWPPLVRIMSENLQGDKYEKTSVAVSASASAAKILIYLIVPLFIAFSGWRFIFVFSAIWGLLIGFLWLFSINYLTVPKNSLVGKDNIQQSTFTENSPAKFFNSGLILVLVVVLLQGILRDGIITWMPSYLNDVFKLDTSVSILSTTILPVFAIISVYFVSFIYRLVKNELKVSMLIWFFAFICSVVLIITLLTQVIVSVLMMAIITACMHGINLMLISIFPLRYKNTGRVSTVSGIINTFTYIGSAISSYGIALLSDSFGWKVTIINWCIVALLGTVISIICMRKWNFKNTIKEKTSAKQSVL